MFPPLTAPLHLNLSIGTQVVTQIEFRNAQGELICPVGAVGVIVAAPTTATGLYIVRLPDGREVTFGRQELSIRKHYQRAPVGLERTGPDLYQFIIYRCIVGSRAYGLDHEGSDTDRRGIYLPPADLHWSLAGVPEQLENIAAEECYWELQKFINLALKANPNILECLYTPLVEETTPLAEELLAMRPIFLSKMVYQTYNGYVMSQFKKLEQDLRTSGELKWKHAMHLIRLLLSGITVLREGFVPVRLDEQRDDLMAIRREEWPWEEVNAWRLALHKEFDSAFTFTRLPERPDYARANDFLLKARRSVVS